MINFKNKIFLINKEHSQNIKEWVLNNIELIKKNKKCKHSKRKNCWYLTQINKNKKLMKLNFPYKSIEIIEKELLNLFKLKKYNYEEIGIMIWYMEEGYTSKIHKDNIYSSNELTCTRLNVMISKPNIGGEPIIFKNNGIVIESVIENEPWICVAGKHNHSSVCMSGKKPRILLTFSYLIPIKELKKLIYI